jgi:hypothetical protein
VVVLRTPIRGLEPRSSFAKVDLAGYAGANHPLQGSVHRGSANARVLAADKVAQIVGTQMALLTKEDVEDSIALARALAAGGTQTG